MGIKVPYDDLTLKIALLGSEKKLTKKITKKIEQKLNREFGKDKAEKNIKIAEENGITVKTLINSPNYKTIVEEYDSKAAKRFVEILKEEANLNDKEAWAILCANQLVFN